MQPGHLGQVNSRVAAVLLSPCAQHWVPMRSFLDGFTTRSVLEGFRVPETAEKGLP